MDGTSAGTGLPSPRADPGAAGRAVVTRGSGHGPEPSCGTVARAPAFSVSQPSAGQVRDAIVCTTSEPTEPRPASRHSAGVPAGDTSVQRRPGIPTRTTGWDGGAVARVLACAALVWVALAWSAPACRVLARAAASADKATPKAALSSASPASSFFITSAVRPEHRRLRCRRPRHRRRPWHWHWRPGFR